MYKRDDYGGPRRTHILRKNKDYNRKYQNMRENEWYFQRVRLISEKKLFDVEKMTILRKSKIIIFKYRKFRQHEP